MQWEGILPLPPQDYEKLRAFRPLSRLSDEQLILLAARADYRQFRPGQVITEPGQIPLRDYFLLGGRVRVESENAPETVMEAGTVEAENALNHVPGKRRVVAVESCECLVIAQDVLRRMLRDAPLLPAQEALADDSGSEEFQVLMEFYADLRANKLPLPSLPDAALRVRRVADQEGSSLDEVGRGINADPAMSVKLIKACNSPLYRGFSEITTIRDAVVRLGLRTTRQLVMVFAMRELFRSKRPELQEAMTRLWDHSREVAAISWVLARELPGVDPEAALLAGLLHDIGEIPVLHYADHHVNLFADYRQLQAAVASLRGEIGQEVLQHWGFGQAYQDVVLYAEDWNYDSGEASANLADVVIVAQLHAFIGKPQMHHRQLPSFDQVPAFRYMCGMALTPQQSLRVLAEAREQIQALKVLLSGK